MIPFYEHRSKRPYVTHGSKMDFPMHLHVEAELLYVQQGELQLELANGALPLHKGDLSLVFPNVMHGYQTLTPPEETSYLMTICDPSLTGDFENVLLTSCPQDPVLRARQLPPQVEQLFAMYYGQASADSSITKLYMQLLLSLCLPCLTLVSNRDNLPQNLTGQIILYISQHYKEPLSLELLARQFGVSRYHLSRVFSETIHSGFYHYINSLRINCAKGLLRNTDRDILSVGMDCGFENQQTFNRVFKELCGLTPREYRKAKTIPEQDRNWESVRYR